VANGNLPTVTHDANGTAVPVPIYDPATNDTQVFSGNIIPASRINPVAQKVLSYVPLPNQKPIYPLNNFSNYEAFPVSPTRRPFWMGRLDHELGAKSKVYFRYFSTPQDAIRYSGNGGTPAWGAYDSAQHTQRNDRSFALNFTHLFSNTFFVNLLTGVQREWLETGNVLDPNSNFPALLGVGTVVGTTSSGFQK
jgi:hypothetical protein